MVIHTKTMDDKRQATTADAALTVAELAERVGMTVRNLREWKTLGLLPPAEMRGRVGYYRPEVVDRVERIKKLHSEGFTLELMGRMLDAGGDAGDEVIRLAETLRAPFRFGAAAGENVTDQRIAEIAGSLQELGLRVDDFLQASARIRAKTEEIAEIFEAVWLESIWQPFLDAGMPESELPRLQETAARVKPLAVDTVIAFFTSAMDAQIERGIARELGRLDSRRTSD
jgi:DNA-binding transcriptional MerR regulator